MKLWIAEKPSMARDIAKALGGGTSANGHIRLKDGDVVTWAIGHLLEALQPQEYDEKFKSWNLADLPIVPKKFLRKPAKGREQQLKIVCDLIKKARSIVIATDAGREGEAIAWTILEHAGWTGGAERLWTSSLNESHLKQAVRQLIDDSEKKPLFVAAQLRSVADWTAGMTWSRYYNIRCVRRGDRVLSLGRVQTATLALIVDRDLEIENFKPEDYFELKASMSTKVGNLDLFYKPSEEKKIKTQQEAESIARRCEKLDTTLKVEKKAKVFTPPPPFSLPELQMASSAKWGWSAKKTLDVLQELYEKGAVTYPRTDSGCLNENMKGDMPKHLSALRKRSEFRDLANIDPVFRKSVFDDKKIEDHHGIITTDEAVDISSMSPDHKKLFDLIARRFLAALMPDAKGFTTTISAKLDAYIFKTSGTIITEAGWKAVWGGEDEPEEPSKKKKGEDEDDADARRLPPVKDGDPARSDKVDVLAKQTKPPHHFTEGTLLKAMINAGSKDPDAEIRDLLSNGGLGTQATRQEIIEKLKFRAFVKVQGKKIISTARARDFVAIIRADGNRLVDVMATAALEKDMRAVEKNPNLAKDVWLSYVRGLREDIERLKRGPAPRQLMQDPDYQPGGSANYQSAKSTSKSAGAGRSYSKTKSSGTAKSSGRSKASSKGGARTKKG
jgi:DNA topoisomerase-3